MSNVIPMNKPKETDPKCSFCGTTKSQSKKFISNGEGTKHICDKCIAQAKQRIQESTQAA